jgi:membrane protease YdiL (CAAX protease family)
MAEADNEQGPDPQPGAPPAPAPPADPQPGPPGWGEVLAVLTIGVLPNLAAAIRSGAESALNSPRQALPYWLDSLLLCAYSLCAIYPVLYLIGRSGEPLASFGVVRPKLGDLWLGLFLFLVDGVIRVTLARVLPEPMVNMSAHFPAPKGALDYALMAVMHAANGLQEELVTRAYLITRLERLLDSRVLAVALSALLFTSYHVYQGPGWSLAYQFAFGLAYGGLYLLIRRLWPFAIGHTLVNVALELDISLG